MYSLAAAAAATDPLQHAPPAVAEWRLRAVLAEQRLSDLRAWLDDMREQRDRWQAQAERLAALAHYLATINVEGDFVCFEKPKSRL